MHSYFDDIMNNIIHAAELYINKVQIGLTVILRSTLGQAVCGFHIVRIFLAHFM